MRDIKFRAWDNEGERMYEFDLFSYMALNESSQEDLCPMSARCNGLMQYVGFKDKNGKEIYEEDILEILCADKIIRRCVCKWGIHRRIMKSGSEVDIPGFSFIREDYPSFPIVKNHLGIHDLEIIEVIGNIYETPELL